MVKFFSDLYLLQWKNWKLKQRQPVRTFFEMAAPLLTLLILIAVRRSQDFGLRSPDCQFKPTPLISKGSLAALQSFCFLGVCQDHQQKFQSPGLLSETDYKNISQSLKFINKVMSDKAVRQLFGAFNALPSNWSDPEQTKLIKFGSVFSSEAALFKDVNASALMRNRSMTAPIRFPARWDIEIDAVAVAALQPFIRTTTAMSTLFCNVSSAAAGNESDWSAVATLCQQSQFRKNIDANADLNKFFSQTKSTRPDKHTISIGFTEAMKLGSLYREFRQLYSAGVFNVFNRLLQALRSFQLPSIDISSGSINATITAIDAVSNLFCGPGRTIFTEYAEKLKARITNDSDSGPTLPSPTVPPAANDSVKLDVIRPPEEFCYNSTYQKAITSGLGSVVERLGFGNIFNVIFGVIPYFPDTPDTRMYLGKVNETLRGLSWLADWSENYLEDEAGKLDDFLVNSTLMATVRDALNTCAKSSISSNLSSVCERLSKFLAVYPEIEPSNSTDGNWRDVTRQINSLMYRAYYLTACFKLDKLQGFASVDSAENYTKYLIDEFGAYSNYTKPKLFSTILFDKTMEGFVQYRLRFAQDKVDSTRRFKVLDRAWKPTPRSNFPKDFKYFTSFFIHLQELLEQGISSVLSNSSTVPTQTYLTLFPSSCFIEDQFARVIESFLPMIMTLSWIYNVALLVNAIVYEKETRLKEMMKIMGLSDGIHWLSWFVTSIVIMAVAAFLMTVLLKAGQIIVYTNPFLLFIFLFSFVVSTISEAFFISIFFSNSSVAAAFAGVLYFVGYLPYSVIDRFAESMNSPMYAAACLVPQLAFGVGCKFLGKWELAGVGLQWDNYFDTPLTTSSFGFNQVVFMMLFDAALYMLITWYIEKVFPGAYGVPKPWYFLFTRSFWCGNSAMRLAKKEQQQQQLQQQQQQQQQQLNSGDDLHANGNADDAVSADANDRVNGILRRGTSVELNGKDSSHFEEEPTHLKIGVALKALSKIYYPGWFSCRRNAKPFTAVDHLNFNFYEGQVTSFLGHNGAGKSTTMSVLTGLYTPTFGTAYIEGHDIRTEMDAVRKYLGLCPQHNVLFDTLTVEDHIYFYGMLKGLSKDQVAPQIDSFIADVGLKHKRYEVSKNLSGGMKRKLSVAMAFVGNSKIVILDEPTAGVDPHARRSIWDVLAKFRKGRTIILTTHHMDEADILGDRICIINKGKLLCSGSPIFLKKVFGDGYTLTLVKLNGSKCSADSVLQFVQHRVPTAALSECTSSEVNVKLDFSSVDQFAQLFADLDANLKELGIASYGIEECSLEEIFLKVTGCSLEESEELLNDPSVVGLRPSCRESIRRKQRELAAMNAAAARRHSGRSAVAEDSQEIISNAELPDVDSDQENIINNSADEMYNADGADDANSFSNNSGTTCSSEQPATSTTEMPVMNQIRALLVKRFHVLRRSKIGFVAEFLLPSAFILLSLSLLQIVPRDDGNPPMELAPWYMLGNPAAARLKQLSTFTSYGNASGYHDNAQLRQAATQLSEHFNKTQFIGTRCMHNEIFNNDRFQCKENLLATGSSHWSPQPSKLPKVPDDCKCSYDNFPASVKCVNWPKPSVKSLASSDRFENLQNYNITNYIQSTVMEYYKTRFGGYTLFVNDSDTLASVKRNTNDELQVFLRNLMQISQGNITDRFINRTLYYLSLMEQENVTALVNEIWFDNRGYVSGPAYLNVLHNAMLRASSPKADPRRIGISGWTHPITSEKTFVQNVIITNSVISATVVVSIIFALSFIPASFVLFLISERTTGAKHLQFVSGVNPALYWVVNHAWNLVNYLIPLVIVVILFVAFKNYEFIGSETIAPFLITMLLFGFASAPLMYPFSWVMSVPSKAFTVLSCINLLFGFTTTMSVTIVRMIGEQNNDEHMKQVAEILKSVFLVLPHFCLGQSLMELNIFYQVSVSFNELVKNTGMSSTSIKELFDGVEIYDNAWQPTSRYIICLIVHSIIYFCIVLLIEYNCCCKRGALTGRLFRLLYKSKYKMVDRDGAVADSGDAVVDDDVLAEAERAEADDGFDGGQKQLLRLRRLAKVYNTSSGPRAAVKGISLCAAPGECFGFLGVNGAGKTTTFKMLTGDVDPTQGDALVDGYSILGEMVQVHQRLGYCPQFDALLPLLTGRETLQLFARIRGVAESDICTLVQWVAKRVGIEAHIDKTTEQYSGGNKRKLSCGIALIGNPPIIFLDEPTAGMDPGARRSLWRCIQRMVSAGSCVILTTHSMEDCQALCHRLTIMVNGKLQCIGSPQHLKNKFGQGFTVFLRVKRPTRTATAAAAAASADSNRSEAVDIAEVKFSNSRHGISASSNAEQPALTSDADEWIVRAHEQFMQAFPAALLKESHVSTLQYQLQQTVPLADIFACVQAMKVAGHVTDYSVNQTTLDQVFINFAKNQAETGDEVKPQNGLLRRLKKMNPLRNQQPDPRRQYRTEGADAISTTTAAAHVNGDQHVVRKEDQCFDNPLCTADSEVDAESSAVNGLWPVAGDSVA